MGAFARALALFTRKGGEGEYRDGPYYLPVTGGWLSADAGRYANWWQIGYSVGNASPNAMVEACVSAYAQTIAMCPGNHWRLKDDGGRERNTASALTRILRQPNDYQSISDLVLNLTRQLLLTGNAYALGLRNNRFEPTELHMMDSRVSSPAVAETGDIFYRLGGNQIIERRIPGELIVPARDVLHLRLHTPRHPLIGETPLVAAGLQMAAGDAALQQQVLFHSNQARPSFILVTDQKLTQDQANDLRSRWNEQSQGMATGGTPILGAGVKPHLVSTTAKDNELIGLLKLSNEAVAQVYRTPLQILGIGDTPYASTEALMQSWKSGGLGFLLNHIEEAIGLFFKLSGQPDEYLEFDTGALLRSSFKDRVEAWARGTDAGIFGSNEARSDFEFPRVKFGDEPRVQQQDVPLSYWGENQTAPPQQALPAPPTPEAKPQPEKPTAEENRKALAVYGREINARTARYLAVH